MRSTPRRARTGVVAAALGLVWTTAHAEAPVTRSVDKLPVSNGHGAAMLDLASARVTHFREHLFATEEPLLDASGAEQWSGFTPLAVPTRDLLFDAYFGLRVGGAQAWNTSLPVDRDASGYAAPGAGVATLRQRRGDLSLTTYVFAPRALPHASFAMVLGVKNDGATTSGGVTAFSLQNLHLGFGRPGVMADLGENGETIRHDAASGDLAERAFAGVVVARPLGEVARHAAFRASSPASENAFQIVASGAGDLPNLDGEAPTGDGSVSAFQFTVGDLAPGAEAFVGVLFAHHGDPGAEATVRGWLDAVAPKGTSAKALLDAELSAWSASSAALTLPASLSADEAALARQSAAMLEMAQVRESEAFLREHLSKDGEPRASRFGKLPGVVQHRGRGAILASLPPGEWTVTWSRDTAYAIAALAQIGKHDAARSALQFYLGAEAGRFQAWSELSPYAMPPYQISLVRYHGFGVEETDFNDFGPNLEFDGFGLYLWALGRYERASGDTSLADAAYPVITERVGDALVKLIDPVHGLVRADSSIWETHWKGRERHAAYTSITAARGLCDLAGIAARRGDGARAADYRAAADGLRAALVSKLRAPSGGLTSNLEERASGEGYWDAAVWDAFAMELFDPRGALAQATLASLDAALRSPAGVGWSRNDDRADHAGKADLSPWGGEYDSAEWVFTNLRGAVALQLAGDGARAQALVDWTTRQSKANYLAVAETYDEQTGAYKFNYPMMGFGAGAYLLALGARGAAPDPACGAYAPEGGAAGSGGAAGAGAAGAAGAAGSAGAGAAGAGAPGEGGKPSVGGAAGHAGAVAPGGREGGLVGGGGSTVVSPAAPPAEPPTNEAPGCSCELPGDRGPALWLLVVAAAAAARRRRTVG